MPIEKSAVSINFAQGLDTKTDPRQVDPGKFLALQNTVFGTDKLLKKRNGFGNLTVLPDTSAQTLTTFNGNLTAIGSNLQALSAATDSWINAGDIQPVQLSALPLVRSSSSQTAVDTAISDLNLSCTVWLDSNTNNYYQIVDANNGQIIVPAVQLPATSTVPRVFVLGRFFVITFIATVAGSPHLRYIAIPLMDPSNPGSATDISTAVSALGAAYDGVVANNNLYLSWNGNDGGGAIRTTFIDSQLTQHGTVLLAGQVATLMSVTADTTASSAVVWLSYYNSGTTNGSTAAYNQNLVTVLAPTAIIAAVVVNKITGSAMNGINTIFYQVTNTYGFSAVRSDFTRTLTVTQAGVVSATTTLIRSLGLGSKSFILEDEIYFLGAYSSALQPSYFLMKSDGNIVAKLAYSNGGGYGVNQILASVKVSGTLAQVGYRFKDLLVSVNKEVNAVDRANIYTQTGANLASFEFDIRENSSEIANNLHIGGGFLWMYDGAKPVEHGFHVFPEDVVVTTSAAGGLITAQQYFYQVTYEWTDAQGNLHRSAPSVPVSITTAGATSSNTINIPTLRLTEKPNVRLVIYRWSAAQQSFYQITSISSPTLNNPAVDSVAYVDTLADSAILGNLLIYTTGGALENIAAPACSLFTLFKSRLFLIDDENRNTAWYSKVVLENTPVETTDLQTVVLAPTLAAQSNTGGITALSSMDDKVIFFKRNAIYYMVGNGPDATGANNDFSEPTFITSAVGCTNQKSIVFTAQGLMFQSEKGIWLLGRDLSANYVGAPVESFNEADVLSAVNVPDTTQVRFTLDTGVTLMYDYYYNQWGSFINIPAISSTIYQGLHTYLDRFGRVRQETPGLYVDGSSPVLITFTTGWMNFAGLQGFERAYFFYLNGTYLSPHKLSVQIAYDYNSSPTQITSISPDNFNPAWGGDSLYGGSSPWGGTGNLEQWRVFLQQQKCQAFQITIKESYDASFGVIAGAGLTLSGLDLVVGLKSRYPRLKASRQVG